VEATKNEATRRPMRWRRRSARSRSSREAKVRG
jgi:hypothetical protein